MKRILIVCVLTGVFLSVVLLGQSAAVNATADVSQAEGLYQSGRHAQAEQVYLRAIAEADPNDPGAAEAVAKAAKGLTLVYVATDRLPQAKEAVRPLLNRPTPHEIHEIVDEAESLDRVPQVRQLYQEMLASRRNDPQAIWLKTGVAIASAHLDDDETVEAALQDIAANNGSDDRVVEAFGQIAWAYRKLEQYDKARTINQYTVDHWPERERAAYAQQGIVVCEVALGNLEAADKAVEVLAQQFGQDPDASKLVLWSAFGYEDSGHRDEAGKIYEMVVQRYPDAPEALDAQLRLSLAALDAEDPDRMEQTIAPLVQQFDPTEHKAESLRYLADALGWRYSDYANQPARYRDTLALVEGYLLAIANYSAATWPESDWAMLAEKDLATLAIRRGDDAAAEETRSSMLSRYADSEQLPEVLYTVGDLYTQNGRYDKADELFDYIEQHWSAAEDIFWAKTGRARKLVAQGDDAAVQSVLQTLMTDYDEDTRLPEVLCGIAECYYNQAEAIENPIQAAARAQRVSTGEAGELSRQIGQADPPGATENPPGTVRRIEAVPIPERVGQCRQNAIAVFEAVIERWPDDATNAAEAYHFAGECYNRLGDRQKAAAYYQKVCDTWPDYEYAWHLQFLAGSVLEQAVEPGAAAGSEITPEAIAAYERVVANYPDSPAARIAAVHLQRYARDQEGQ